MARLKTVAPVEEQPAPPPAASREPTHAEIQERAYFRYVDRGRTDGCDREDWRLAETELRGGEQPGDGGPDEGSRGRRPTTPAAVRRVRRRTAKPAGGGE